MSGYGCTCPPATYCWYRDGGTAQIQTNPVLRESFRPGDSLIWDRVFDVDPDLAQVIVSSWQTVDGTSSIVELRNQGTDVPYSSKDLPPGLLRSTFLEVWAEHLPT